MHITPQDVQYEQKCWAHAARHRIFRDIEKERAYEIDRTPFGFEFDDKNTPNDWASYIMTYLGQATKMNRETQRFDKERFREQMLKAVTIGVAALEAFDRNNGMPRRHYDRRIT